MQSPHGTTDRVSVEQCTNPDEWDAFVRRNDGPPFTEWGWGTAIESTYGHDRWYFLARVGDEIVGAAPLIHVGSRLFGDQLVSTAFASRGSLVLGDQYRETAARALLDRTRELADELGVDFVSLRSRDLGEEPHAAFDHRNRYVAYEIQLDEGADEVWDGLASSRRTHVRQGRENVSVTVGDSLADLRTFYRLYLKRMRGHGTPPHPFGFFEEIWDQFYDEGKLRLYLAFADGTPVNATLDLLSKNWIYHWKEVSDYEYRDLDGGSLLVWEGLEWGAENDFERFDLGRTREGTGIYVYKKSFGGEKVWMDDYHYFPNGEDELPDAESNEYERVKRVWRRLPLPVTRLIGPRIRGQISL